jgi:hypothetical protein
MANNDKRTDRAKGNYDTYEQLRDEVLTLHSTKKMSRAYMGKLVGVDGTTVTRIINENKVPEAKVDLTAMFNRLWITTTPPEENDDE